MKTYLMNGAAALALTAGAVSAGGLDRSGQSVMSVFSPDNTVTTTVGVVIPSFTGSDVAGSGGSGSYDVGETYTQYGLSYTNALNDRFNYSVILDQPFGADIDYNGNPLTDNLAGTSADLNSTALSLVARYRLGDRISVFGGISAQRINADVTLNGRSYTAAIGAPLALSGVARQLSAQTSSTITAQTLAGALAGQTTLDGVFGGLAGGNVAAGRNAVQTQVNNVQNAFATGGGYAFNLENSTKPNYFIGAAYEIPEIALRIAGTYRFETTHKADYSENFGGGLLTSSGSMEFKTPASFNLEAQTGIAKDTLLTFSYRWTDFSAVNIIPATLGSDLVNLDDAERYTLGVARRFSDKLAGSFTLSYEPKGDKLVSPLGPTNGLFGVSIGGQYTEGNLKISGGINYTRVGDAVAEVASVGVANFKNNHLVGVGIKAEISF
ncbi:outer membrane protein transport protein [Thetidibacter halocola]|uniref:Outer membrane protein transport protein n=1 Tax=Thetidibacter halocola TaxID=2827239 RepID=A0A8J7WCL6_9RHOB|nr:outer membrane protein transport protein [Thetidibacter halocola]MBS0122683.1 outer membrane protein transport protein [Thetidibacter halocola]